MWNSYLYLGIFNMNKIPHFLRSYTTPFTEIELNRAHVLNVNLPSSEGPASPVSSILALIILSSNWAKASNTCVKSLTVTTVWMASSYRSRACKHDLPSHSMPLWLHSLIHNSTITSQMPLLLVFPPLSMWTSGIEVGPGLWGVSSPNNYILMSLL